MNFCVKYAYCVTEVSGISVIISPHRPQRQKHERKKEVEKAVSISQFLLMSCGSD